MLNIFTILMKYLAVRQSEKYKNIKTEAFREYSHIQGYVTSAKFF